METKNNAVNVGTCSHLLPFLEQAMSFGARVTAIEQGYSEVHQVVRLSQALHLTQQDKELVLPDTVEYFESSDRHHHPVTEAGIICRQCKQVITWNKE